jgi:hypothetical protein
MRARAIALQSPGNQRQITCRIKGKMARIDVNGIGVS